MDHNNYHIKYSRPVQESDISYIANNLREADLEELKASHGAKVSPRALLMISVGITPDPVTLLSGSGSGEPIALLGTVPPSLLGSNTAKPWMLGTEAVFRYPKKIVMGGRSYVREMLERYGALENYVDVRNVVSVRWLQSIGFSLDEPAPYGPDKMLFHRFYARGIHANE